MSVVLSQLLHCDNVLPAFLLLPEPNCEQSERDRWFSAQRNSALCSQTSTKAAFEGLGELRMSPWGPKPGLQTTAKVTGSVLVHLAAGCKGWRRGSPTPAAFPVLPVTPRWALPHPYFTVFYLDPGTWAWTRFTAVYFPGTIHTAPHCQGWHAASPGLVTQLCPAGPPQRQPGWTKDERYHSRARP